MNIDELSPQLHTQHGAAISAFAEAIFGPSGMTNAETVQDADRKVPRLGPLPSRDPNVELTFVGDLAPLPWMMEDPTLEGFVLTISMAGHHRTSEHRVSLASEESDVWAQAIVGEDWSPFLYRAGTLSGINGQLSTVYYRVFLDDYFIPVDKPAGLPDGQLRRVTDL